MPAASGFGAYSTWLRRISLPMNCLNSLGRNFAQAFEARDLAVLPPSFVDGLVALGFAVAINRLLLVAHAEQRRLQHVEMAVVHELIEEPEEIRDHQIADVQAVHVGVGGENDLVVAQAFEVVLDVERCASDCTSRRSCKRCRA